MPQRKSSNTDDQMTGTMKEKEIFQTDIYVTCNNQYTFHIISKTSCMTLEVIRIPRFTIIHS